MSLYRQLWIGIAITMMLVFGTTFVINSVSSSRYLEEQLSIKNNDDASAVALSLSQQNLDRIALEIQLAALLDQGSYRRVSFRDSDGEMLFDRRQAFDDPDTPAWFQSLFSLQSEPGRADVSNGWNFLGTLTLESHESFAYRELWASGKRMLIALVVAIAVAGLIATLLLNIILRPLDSVVAQARAIGERRFTVISEPRTRELAVLTGAMNTLSGRVRDMLTRESARLGHELEPDFADPTTGLLNQESFYARLSAKIESEDVESEGSLAVSRIEELRELNQEYGRDIVDTLLSELGKTLRIWGEEDKTLSLARIAGADIAVLAPQDTDPQKLGEELQQRIREVLERHDLGNNRPLPTACARYHADDSIDSLMDAMQQTLELAATDQDAGIQLSAGTRAQLSSPSERSAYWRRLLVSALAEKRLWIETYPVLNSRGELLHDTGMLRLSTEDGPLKAGQFLPWVNRLDLDDEVDRAVVSVALEHIENTQRPLCISLTAASLQDDRFIPWLQGQLGEHSQAATQLSATVSEALAYSHPKGFRRLKQALAGFAARLGIGHMGYRVSDIDLLGELGADHLKIAPMFVRGSAGKAGSTALMRTYAGIANSLGIDCIAEGVESDEDRANALACGTTGITGPGVSTS